MARIHHGRNEQVHGVLRIRPRAKLHCPEPWLGAILAQDDDLLLILLPKPAFLIRDHVQNLAPRLLVHAYNQSIALQVAAIELACHLTTNVQSLLKLEGLDKAGVRGLALSFHARTRGVAGEAVQLPAAAQVGEDSLGGDGSGLVVAADKQDVDAAGGARGGVERGLSLVAGDDPFAERVAACHVVLVRGIVVARVRGIVVGRGGGGAARESGVAEVAQTRVRGGEAAGQRERCAAP